MAPDPDELAGVVDLFGGLEREKLVAAFRDLAARSGDSFEAESVEAAIEAALEEYYLVEVDPETAEEGESPELLVAGPTALPTLPEGGEDLPHLLDAERRTIGPDVRGEAALAALRGDAARAVDAGDAERVETLRSVCYDVEAWAPVETRPIRERLDDAVDGS